MNTTDAKNISLVDYLQSIGIMLCKKQGNNVWYFSSFRNESEPSFKVNLARNLWYDFGLGKGGNLIEFIMEQHGIDSVSHAMQSCPTQRQLFWLTLFLFARKRIYLALKIYEYKR